ncbi:hypothetical protein AB0L44_46150 [Nonomuraea wenchangensis]|uniref:hypothetical protein n=1 Tax=Nonomuraea wenchangensis TaxID=568860 RepID=UPI003421758A
MRGDLVNVELSPFLGIGSCLGHAGIPISTHVVERGAGDELAGEDEPDAEEEHAQRSELHDRELSPFHPAAPPSSVGAPPTRSTGAGGTFVDCPDPDR